MDLLVEAAGLTLAHYDKDFDAIARVTGRRRRRLEGRQAGQAPGTVMGRGAVVATTQ